MKRVTRFICIILVLGMFVAIPAQAESVVDTRESAFFASYGTDLYKTSSTSFQIWFDVIANAGSSPQVLGASKIVLYRSTDRQTWTNIKTYMMESYSYMVAQNTESHGGYVPYNFASSGYYYRACVTFYAKSSAGTAQRDIYTEIIRM